MEQTLYDKLLNCIAEYAEQNPNAYVNPYFLMEVIGSIEEYGDIENYEVDKWAKDMWGR